MRGNRAVQTTLRRISIVFGFENRMAPCFFERNVQRLALPALLFRDRKQLISIANKQSTVSRDRSAVDRASHIDLSYDFLLSCGRQNRDVTILVAEIYLPVYDHRRAPHRGKHVVNPKDLSCLCVQAVQEAAEIRIEQHSIKDRPGRNRSADLVILPNYAALGDVSSFGGVDAVEMPYAFSVLRVLSVGNVDFVVEDYRSADQFVTGLWPD